MPPPVGPRHLVAAMMGAASMAACGASIRGLYESDVRFEHCMALDTSPDVKPTLQRACWDEWLRFYTFGQTRDRIDYARHRGGVLGAASDFDESDDPPRVAVLPATPEPTSVGAPPPSMMALPDAGATDGGAEADHKALARARCTADCETRLENCLDICKRTPPCEQACTARHKRCTARCSAIAHGSR
jgi:hypothetical protein